MIIAHAITHVGNVRQRNEDTIAMPGVVTAGMPPTPICVEYPSSAPPLAFAVVDGMGGHRGGQQASRLVAVRLAESEASAPMALELLTQANSALYEEMRRFPELSGMGATVAAVVIDPRTGQATVANVGDARCYQHAADSLLLLTTDDRPHVGSHLVTQSLGGADQPTTVEPHLVELVLADRHKLLLCSDGLTEVVSFDAIRSTMTVLSGPEAAGELLQSALENGAPDNVSILILEFLLDD